MAAEAATTSGPKRVLYLARAPFVSGAERALMTMLRGLDRGRVEPMVVLGNETPLVGQVEGLGIPVQIIRLGKRTPGEMLWWRRSVKRIKRLLRTFRPVLMHANDVPSSQAMSYIGGKEGVPRVAHVRWTISSDDAAWWLARGVEHVICISQYIRDELGVVSGTPLARAQIEVKHDAIDWPAGAADEPPARRQRQDGPARLGFAGQLIESKGLDLVIEAMGKLPADRRPLLTVAGEDKQTGGAYKNSLQRLAASRGVEERIRWLGFVDDVAALYEQIDAVVCPSREEPLGLVPMEAAQFALPTLANNVGGFRETIEEGRSGVLVEPTVSGWVRALERMEQLDLVAMGRAAWSRARERHAPDAYGRWLMALYERWAEPRVRPSA